MQYPSIQAFQASNTKHDIHGWVQSGLDLRQVPTGIGSIHQHRLGLFSRGLTGVSGLRDFDGATGGQGGFHGFLGSPIQPRELSTVF